MGSDGRAVHFLSRVYAALAVWAAGVVLIQVLRRDLIVAFTLGAVIAVALYAATAHVIFAMLFGRTYGVVRNPRLADRLRLPVGLGLVGVLVVSAIHAHFTLARTTAIGVCAAFGLVAERHRALFLAQLWRRVAEALGLRRQSAAHEENEGPLTPHAPEREPDPESVGALLDQARLAVAGEDGRARHLDSKAAQLLTFSGVVLALTGTLGGIALSTDLAGTARVLAGVFFVGALAVLLVGAVFALIAFRPAEYLDLDEDALEELTRPPAIYLPPWRIRGDIATGLFAPLRRARERNERKARWIKRAAATLVVGLVVVAAEATILGLHQIGAIDGGKTHHTKTNHAH